MPKLPDIIDAVPILSKWYGPDSIACHSVKIIGPEEAESEFKVGKNLSGSLAHPPMFDRLTQTKPGVFTTDTEAEDAWQHFVEEVGVTLIPAHNVVGLMREALVQARFPNLEPTTEGYPYVTGFDYMRFKPLFPRQPFSFTGNIETLPQGAIGTFTRYLERRPFARNFQIELGEPLDEETRNRMLAQHWISEANAQGMGMFGLASARKGVVPALMEIGRSIFYKVPILDGDVLRSHLTNVLVDDEQITGDAKSYFNNTIVARQENFLLQFVPIDDIKRTIEGVKIL